jgi:hypothetical protein
LETYLELIEMVLLELLQEQTQRYFGNAAGADRDGIFELQQEQTMRYFGIAAKADGNGMLVIQQEQMERYFLLFFFYCAVQIVQ